MNIVNLKMHLFCTTLENQLYANYYYALPFLLQTDLQLRLQEDLMFYNRRNTFDCEIPARDEKLHDDFFFSITKQDSAIHSRFSSVGVDDFPLSEFLLLDRLS